MSTKDLPTDSRLVKAKEYWTGKTVDQPVRIRWWQSEHVVRQVNRRICGEGVPGPSGGDVKRIRMEFPGRKFRRAISVGGGTGVKEMALLTAGLLEFLDLFELSELRIELGIAQAQKLGIESRVRFHQTDALEQVRDPAYDLVYWNNSLHHMLDVPRAVAWSHGVLENEGVFYMNDFVGPTRMQWSDQTLEIVSGIRAALPERFLKDPNRKGASLVTRIRRRSAREMSREDPTECADSDRILDAVRDYFPEALVLPIGGAVYHLVLNDVLHNIDEELDREYLDLLMALDEVCSPFCDPHYCVAIGRKGSGS